MVRTQLQKLQLAAHQGALTQYWATAPRRWLSAAQRALGVLPAQGVEEVDVTQQPEPQEAKDTALSGEEPEILSL